jgi:hypothetical protein
MRAPPLRRPLLLTLLLLASSSPPLSSVDAQLSGCPARFIRVNNTPGIISLNFVRAMKQQRASHRLFHSTKRLPPAHSLLAPSPLAGRVRGEEELPPPSLSSWEAASRSLPRRCACRRLTRSARPFSSLPLPQGAGLYGAGRAGRTADQSGTGAEHVVLVHVLEQCHIRGF